MDLYNYSNQNGTGDVLGGMDSAEILKAMEAGLKTGMQYNNEINNGGGLKVESLDSVLKILGNRMNLYLGDLVLLQCLNLIQKYLNQLVQIFPLKTFNTFYLFKKNYTRKK